MRQIVFVFLLGTLFNQQISVGETVGDHLSLDSIKERCAKFSKIEIGKSAFAARECKITEFGNLGKVEGENYLFALYCIMPNHSPLNSKCGDKTFDAGYHARRGMAVFTSQVATKKVTLLFEKADPDIGIYYYEKPEIVDVGKNKLLFLPIHVDGTGNGNASEYYLLRNRKWVLIESAKWQKQVHDQLPADLKIHKGIWPDLKNMKAVAGLYKKDDANCCPTGGRALIDLGLQENSITLKKLTFDTAADNK